jgi:hypothetical protein
VHAGQLDIARAGRQPSLTWPALLASEVWPIRLPPGSSGPLACGAQRTSSPVVIVATLSLLVQDVSVDRIGHRLAGALGLGLYDGEIISTTPVTASSELAAQIKGIRRSARRQKLQGPPPDCRRNCDAPAVRRQEQM